jgi:hypothetical protein
MEALQSSGRPPTFLYREEKEGKRINEWSHRRREEEEVKCFLYYSSLLSHYFE